MSTPNAATWGNSWDMMNRSLKVFVYRTSGHGEKGGRANPKKNFQKLNEFMNDSDERIENAKHKNQAENLGLQNRDLNKDELMSKSVKAVSEDQEY